MLVSPACHDIGFPAESNLDHATESPLALKFHCAAVVWDDGNISSCMMSNSGNECLALQCSIMLCSRFAQLANNVGSRTPRDQAQVSVSDSRAGINVKRHRKILIIQTGPANAVYDILEVIAQCKLLCSLHQGSCCTRDLVGSYQPALGNLLCTQSHDI